MENDFLTVKTLAELASILEINSLQLKLNSYSVYKNKRYSTFKIKKKSGGSRIIYAPTSNLKFVQRKLNILLNNIYSPKDCVTGFVKGKSILHNAQVHSNKKYVLNIDLANFFDSINFGRIRGLFLSTPFKFNEEIATALAQICSFDNKLPQGAPTSPIISNFISFTLDKQLRKLAQKYQLSYTRYADDITFSTNLNKFPKAIAYQDVSNNTQLGKELIDIIEQNDFKINYQKIRLLGKFNRQEVTGLTVNKFPNVERKFIRQVRAMLHSWRKHGYVAAEKEYYDKYSKRIKKLGTDFRDVIRGKLNFISQIKGKQDGVYLKLLAQAHSLDNSFFPPPSFSYTKLEEMYFLYSELKNLKFNGKRINSKQRGYKMQDLLVQLFEYYKVSVNKSFTRNTGGEQVDVAFKFDSWHYLVECKWVEELPDVRDVRGLIGQVTSSGKQTMGLFFSVNGWSKHVIPRLKEESVKCIILMDGNDLEEILKGKIDLIEVLEKKIERFNLYTEPFVSVNDILTKKNNSLSQV